MDLGPGPEMPRPGTTVWPQGRPRHRRSHRPQTRVTGLLPAYLLPTGPATGQPQPQATGPAHSQPQPQARPSSLLPAGLLSTGPAAGTGHRPGPPTCCPQAQTHAATGPSTGHSHRLTATGHRPDPAVCCPPVCCPQAQPEPQATGPLPSNSRRPGPPVCCPPVCCPQAPFHSPLGKVRKSVKFSCFSLRK